MDRLTKNFMWMAAANIVGSFFTVLIIICLARRLEPVAFGYISYAQTIAIYLMTFIDLGFPTYGTREISKDRSNASGYVSDIISFRLLVAGGLYLIVVILTLLSGQSLTLKMLLITSCLLLFYQACTTEWAFQGLEKMHMILISSAVTTFLQFGLIYLFIKRPGDLLKAPLIMVIGTIPVAIIFLNRLKFKLRLKSLDYGRIRFYLSSSLTIWLISVFVQVYNGLDIVLLNFFRPPEEVGYFGIARKAVGGAALLLVFLTNAALPRLSATFCDNRPEFNAATKKFLKLSIIMTAFVFLPIMFFSDSLISMTVGDGYLPASLPLRIMIIGLIIIVFNLPYSTGLIAAGFEKYVLGQAIASAALSVSANLILIPRYGMAGAAVSFVMAEALAFVWIMAVYKKKIGIICKSVV